MHYVICITYRQYLVQPKFFLHSIFFLKFLLPLPFEIDGVHQNQNRAIKRVLGKQILDSSCKDKWPIMKGTSSLSLRCSESYKWWLNIHTNHPSRDSMPSGSPGESLLMAPAWWSRPHGDAPASDWEGVQSVCVGTSVISQGTLMKWFQLILLVSFLSSLPVHFILRLLFSNLNLAIRGNGPECSLGQMI